MALSLSLSLRLPVRRWPAESSALRRRPHVAQVEAAGEPLAARVISIIRAQRLQWAGWFCRATGPSASLAACVLAKHCFVHGRTSSEWQTGARLLVAERSQLNEWTALANELLTWLRQSVAVVVVVASVYLCA